MSTIFADVTSGRLSEDDFVIVIGKIMLYFLYLAIGELVGSYAMWIGFTLGGQSICARMRYVFHGYAVVSGRLADSPSIQS